MFENRELVRFFRKSKKFQQDIPVSRDLLPNVQHSISVCTVCMNRLHDLKEAYPKTLRDNDDYADAEFVLLDYNSSDGMEEWVKDFLRDDVRSGRVRYYRTDTPINFLPCHSYNVSFRLAKNDIIAKLDADNFTGPGYLHRLNQLASVGDKIIMVPETFLRVPERMLLRGRFAIFRHDLYELGAFDEDMDRGFGFDDVSLVFRCFLAGFKVMRFESEFVMTRIETTDEDRTKFMDINRESTNMKIATEKLAKMELKANVGRDWGVAVVRT